MEADDDILDEERDDNEDEESKLEIIRLKKKRDKKRKAVDKQTAFIEFKIIPEGKQYEDLIINNRNELKDKKMKIK
jgi:hypothetical protein